MEDLKTAEQIQAEKLEKRKTLCPDTLDEASDYLSWKDAVPKAIRRAVEGAILGEEVVFEMALPRTTEYLNTLTQSIKQNSFPTDFQGNKIIQNLLLPLERVRTEGGFLNLFETMANPDISWSLKTTLYETQLKSSWEWIIQKDLEEDAEKREEQKKTEEKSEDREEKQEPPPASDEVKSSMEADQENGEGTPKEQFTVSPFYGGYAKSHTFNQFDLNKLKWVPQERKLLESNQVVPYEKDTSRVIYGLINGGRPLAIPCYYNFTLDNASLKTNSPEGSAKLLQDERGDWFLLIDKAGVWRYEITMGQAVSEKKMGSKEGVEITGKLPDEVTTKIRELRDARRPEMKKAREIVKFVRGHLTYSNSHEAWEGYSKIPQNFFTEIWAGREADCHVSNTLAVRILTEAGITSRFVGGHYVKNKNEKGEAIMHAGSGHAWLEVWDGAGRKWVRLDATPKGDPTVDEQEQEKDLEAEGRAGDYGENDEIMSKEELAEITKKMQDQGKSEKSKKRETIEESSFAEEANCTPEQAKEFLRALERVREIKNEQGERITDSLIREWKKIIEERKIEKSLYQGPVRMDEGDNLTDPVTAVIDVKSKELNPLGFEKIVRQEILSYEFGGINTYYSFDLSGSMINPDAVSGRSKADVQRDVALLFVDSLMQCAFVYRKEADQTELLPLKIMVAVASEKGSVTLPLTDKWSPKEQWQFYSSLNKLARGGTPTHETLEHIEHAFDKERARLKKEEIPAHRMPLDYVVEVTDGAPDNFTATVDMHDKLQVKGAVVRSYVIGGGEIDRPEYASVDSFSRLPEILSSDIIGQFKKLHPRKIKL